MDELFDMFYEATGISFLSLFLLIMFVELILIVISESIGNAKNNRTSDVSDAKNDKVSLVKKDDANVVDISDDLKKYYDYEVVENDEQNKIK